MFDHNHSKDQQNNSNHNTRAIGDHSNFTGVGGGGGLLLFVSSLCQTHCSLSTRQPTKQQHIEPTRIFNQPARINKTIVVTTGRSQQLHWCRRRRRLSPLCVVMDRVENNPLSQHNNQPTNIIMIQPGNSTNQQGSTTIVSIKGKSLSLLHPNQPTQHHSNKN